MRFRRIGLTFLSVSTAAAGGLAIGPASPARADLPANCGQVGQTVTCTFVTDGVFTVPDVPTMRVVAVGGDGAPGGAAGAPAAPGGAGAQITSEVPLAGPTAVIGPGTVMTIAIGGDAVGAQGGANGGGDGGTASIDSVPYFGGGGGGATVITVPGPESRIVVAGGGGGGGGFGRDNGALVTGGSGGDAGVAFGSGSNGGPRSGDGRGAASGAGGGVGGDQGEGAPVTAAGSDAPSGGAGGVGGAYYVGNGGGGGAGYTGGGGGGAGAGSIPSDSGTSYGAGGGGGAGMSYAIGVVTRTANTGDPRVVISYDIPPETTIVSRPDRFVTAPSVTWAYESDVDDATFDCATDAGPVECGDSSVKVKAGRAGRHVFTVAATDPITGAVDPTPATASWFVPRDDRAFNSSKKWDRRKSSTAFRGSYLRAAELGQRLMAQVEGDRLVLVAATGPRFGKVKVELAGRKIAVVDLGVGNRMRHRRVLPIASFDAPTAGRLVITTRSRKPVVIDGLGVSGG